MMIVAILLAGVFAVFGGIHLYWAVGGRRGVAKAIPTSEAGDSVFKPGAFACAIVALGLFAFSTVCLVRGSVLPLAWVSPAELRVVLWLMVAIFALRTLGDFRYVGVTRRISTTDFARLDRRFYTPLCLVIAVGVAALAITFRK